MHILHMTNYLPGLHSHAGGAEHACLRTLRLLADAGVRNTVWTLGADAARRGASDPAFTWMPLPVVEDLLPAPARRSVEVGKWYAWQKDPRAGRAAEAWLERNPVDLLQVYNAQFLGLDLIHRARRHGIRVLQVVYDYWLFCPLTTLVDRENRICRRQHGPVCLACLPPILRPAQRLFLAARRRSFRRHLAAIDHFVVLSQASASLLRDFGVAAERVSVVPIPMDLDRLQPDETRVEPGLIVYAGWLQKRKGLEVLLRALKQVLARHPQVHLDVFGMQVKWEREHEKRVRAAATDPDLVGRVTFRDQVAYADVKQRVRQAALVVIPEQWENMSPVLLLEAQLMGKAVVASRIGGIPEFVQDGETGFLFEWDNVQDLADTINRLLDDEAACARAGRNAAASLRRLLAPEALTARLQHAQAVAVSRPGSRPGPGREVSHGMAP